MSYCDSHFISGVTVSVEQKVGLNLLIELYVSLRSPDMREDGDVTH